MSDDDTTQENNEKELHCSFCGKSQKKVTKLIAGPNDAHICDECVYLSYDIITDEVSKGNMEIEGDIPSPREIHEFLNQYIIGQEKAKETISVAVHNHYKRINTPIVDDVEIDKSNIMLIGPSGSGKTLIAQTIARLLEVPYAIADATTITESGYVGDDVETILSKLLQAADNDVEKAQKGIIYIDEIDKKALRGDNASVSRDVSGEGVQQALLKIIEGTVTRVPSQGGRKHPQQEYVNFDTSNVLFIVGGAFVGLEKVVENEKDKGVNIGFNAELKDPEEKLPTDEWLKHLEPEHLVKYGLIPEIVGRIPVHTILHELSEDELVYVLTEPKNALARQFKKLFSLENIDLEFEDEALREVARTAKERGTGARGLRSVLENCLIPVQYELPELRHQGVERILITKDVIINNEKPQLEYKKNGTE